MGYAYEIGNKVYRNILIAPKITPITLEMDDEIPGRRG